MLRQIFTSTLYYRICCLVLFSVAAAASFNGFYEQSHFSEAGLPGAFDHASFEAMIDGTAYRPYVYRQLLPNIANYLNGAVPESIKSRLYDHQGKFPDAYINAIAYSPTARNKVYFFRYLVVYILDYLFAVLAVYAMYWVCRALEIPSAAAVFAPVVVILLVPYIMTGGGYLYDYPELAFLALAAWIALKFDWWWVIPVAVFGAWNKESFLLFMPTLYPIFRRRSSRLSALLGVGVLGLICTAIYFYMRIRFAHNSGSTAFVFWRDQLDLLLHPRLWLVETKPIYGLRMITGYTAAPAALLVWSVWRVWRYLPTAIKRHAQITAVINVPLFLLFSYPGELRDLSLLYIAFLVVLAVNLNLWIGDSQPPKPLPAG
jgi:hypothetical protein